MSSKRPSLLNLYDEVDKLQDEEEELFKKLNGSNPDKKSDTPKDMKDE